MGHKSNPIGLRLQINRTWDSRWYAEGKNYAQMLEEDLKMRKFIMATLPQAAISKVVIERPAKLCRVSIYAARPGVIIGKKGADIEKLRKQGVDPEFLPGPEFAARANADFRKWGDVIRERGITDIVEVGWHVLSPVLWRE